MKITLFLTALVLSLSGTLHATTTTVPLASITSDPIDTGVVFKSKHSYRVQVDSIIVNPQAYLNPPFVPMAIVQEDWTPLAQVGTDIIVKAIEKGQLNIPLELNYKPAGDVVGQPLYVRLVDSPAIIDYGAFLTITELGQPPAVKVKGKNLLGRKLALSGIASKSTEKVIVTVNGKEKKARGTTKWNLKTRLKPGRNEVSIIAYDDDGQESKPQKLKFSVLK